MPRPAAHGHVQSSFPAHTGGHSLLPFSVGLGRAVPYTDTACPRQVVAGTGQRVAPYALCPGVACVHEEVRGEWEPRPDQPLSKCVLSSVALHWARAVAGR